MKLNLPWSIFNGEIFLRKEGEEEKIARTEISLETERTLCRSPSPLFFLSKPIFLHAPFSTM